MVKMLKLLLGAIALLILISSCKNTVNNEILPPPQVKFVEKSPDSAAVETGIDAEEPPANVRPNPLKNAIFLQWHPVNHEGLKSYDIYRRASDTTGSFTKIAEVLQAFGSRDTTFLDTSAQLQTLYYYYIIARDDNGNEGERSHTEHYTLLPKPQQLNIPVGNSLYSGFFEWTFQNSYVPQYIIFRVEKQVAGDVYQPYDLKLLELNDISPVQHWSAQELGIASLTPGNYRWRVDIRILRDNRQGAESVWGYFRVQ